jgi:hypothetical protein
MSFQDLALPRSFPVSDDLHETYQLEPITGSLEVLFYRKLHRWRTSPKWA